MSSAEIISPHAYREINVKTITFGNKEHATD